MPAPRLKRRADFVRVARTGKSRREPGLALQTAPRPPEALDAAPSGTPRVGITATRRIGGAVSRNRAKRRLRALADQILADRAQPDKDYVLIARNGTLTRSYADLTSDLLRALAKLGELKSGDPRT